jgi:putative transposase
MTRPLRIEYAGAVYHITSRGDRREDIFEDDDDRRRLLDTIAQAMEKFDAAVLAYCLMDNHYHLIIRTNKANLSTIMRNINGIYSQKYNRRHSKVGHVFQGRFASILVDSESYFSEVCRYVELNPVRACIVKSPEEWQWSSFLAHTNRISSPKWLDTTGLYSYILNRENLSKNDKKYAAILYETYVKRDLHVRLWQHHLRQQIYLGDEDFVDRMQNFALKKRLEASEIPRMQRHKSFRLAPWLEKYDSENEAIWHAYKETALTMTAIADELEMSISKVSRILSKQHSHACKKSDLTPILQNGIGAKKET